MIRILHAMGSLELGGTQSFIMNVYRKIDRTKIQFDFIIDHEQDMYLADEVRELGGKIYIMPAFQGWNIAKVTRAWNIFFKQHREYKILHSHIRGYASIYFYIASKYGVKTIIHSHSISNGTGVQSIVKKILQYPLRYQADYFLACSQNAGEWLYGKKIKYNKNYTIINNGIDTAKFIFHPDKREELRERYGLNGQFVCGNIGRFVEAKNHLFLIEVFSYIHDICPESKLLLVGDGTLKTQIVEKLKEEHLEDNVILLGSRDDVADILQVMDFFIFPSKWEGLGIVAIEAQASGLPVILSENIPEEVCLTNLVLRMNLCDGAKMWAQEILKKKDDFETTDRTKYNNMVYEKFDVREATKKLIDVYEKLDCK